MFQLSRYSFLFSRDEHNFIYNSRSNNFYELPNSAYEFIQKYLSQSLNNYTSEEIEFINLLKDKKIIVDDVEDDSYCQELRMLYNIRAYSTSVLNLTLVPTISCNLRCPYCFEENKPQGFMSDETISDIVAFVKNNKWTNDYSITWFGGEPLLGLRQIEKVLQTLHEQENLKLVGHSIVTNGTLLTEKAVSLFKTYSLDSIQITLDGFRNTHNKKRFTIQNHGTFDLIIRNVKNFIVECPETYVSFRINVDNSNSHEYVTTFKYLNSIFPNANIGIYAGILRANKGCESETFFHQRIT